MWTATPAEVATYDIDLSGMDACADIEIELLTGGDEADIQRLNGEPCETSRNCSGALLLLYDGEGRGSRAVAAAHAMRRTLRALGRPKTSFGSVTLKMHVGVHSGLLHLFLVGDSHRELLATGPAASRTVETDATSEAGEMQPCASAARSAPRRRASHEPRGLRYLGEARGGSWSSSSAGSPSTSSRRRSNSESSSAPKRSATLEIQNQTRKTTTAPRLP
jgi:hypothetical protein